jgi:hypothetical protein
MTLGRLLGDWHDFYLVIAAASGTLLGAMFVVVSIGTGFLTADRADATRIFLTPTVMHVSGVLVACIVLLVPTLTRPWLTALLGLGSLTGLGYTCFIWRQVWTRQVDWTDRLWHGLMPPVACLALACSAVLTGLGHDAGFDALAGALVLLLVAAIRNAWDMIVFLVSRDRG